MPATLSLFIKKHSPHLVLIIAIHPIWLPESQKIEDLFKLLGEGRKASRDQKRKMRC